MLADKNSFPASEERNLRSEATSKPVNTGPLWARIRHIEARVDAVELRVSTVRRDCDRIEKSNSRENLKYPLTKNSIDGQLEKELAGLI